VYKVLAYRRAAQTLREYNRDVTSVWKEGRLKDIPGVGDAIAEKLNELLSTGKLGFYEKLKKEIPVGLVEMLTVPDLGPKKAAMFWKKLGITSVAELEKAAKAGKLRELPGMGEKSEAKILAGIVVRARRSSGRTPLGQVWPLAQEMLKFLRGLPGVKVAEVAGSVRRMCSTIGDLDFLVAAEEAEPIMAAFVTHPNVARVLGHGPTKSSVELANGLQADLRILPPERFGTLLQYFTGSQAHNVKLRERALDRDLSLNEHAFTKKNGQEILCATEAEVYRALGLQYIPPELREDRGEIQAAARGELPRLIDVKDLQSELHAHSTWSDGTLSIRDMALAARSRGLKCLAITDHSYSLGVTGGLTPERLRAQRREIDAVQAELGAGFSLLQGAEVEIRADGSMDFNDDVLEDLDIVVASLHTSLRQERDKVTARLIRAIENRHVDIIGHPTGRLFPDRPGADLDMEAVLLAAAGSGVALEINANPARLDLDDVYAKRALELGCLLAINTDAHRPGELDLAHFGVGVARRAWATTESVLNAWPVEKLLQWLDERGHRRVRKAAAVIPVTTPEAPPAKPEKKTSSPGLRAPASARRTGRGQSRKTATVKREPVAAAQKNSKGKRR
ncbi:MAG: DNA polymerase/3'-5' exonuclease PolX, partial [Anaerolineales bacterium]